MFILIIQNTAGTSHLQHISVRINHVLVLSSHMWLGAAIMDNAGQGIQFSGQGKFHLQDCQPSPIHLYWAGGSSGGSWTLSSTTRRPWAPSSTLCGPWAPSSMPCGPWVPSPIPCGPWTPSSMPCGPWIPSPTPHRP